MDFANLVLGPVMAAFGRPITFTPVKSEPGVAAYPARGVYAVKQVTIRTEDGGGFTDQQPTLGIRLADYPVPPMQSDSFTLNGVAWWVWDVQPDGQGGADLVIKQSPVPT